MWCAKRLPSFRRVREGHRCARRSVPSPDSALLAIAPHPSQSLLATIVQRHAEIPHARPRTRREASKAKDVRLTNIEAAKAVADAVRTSLGPRGMGESRAGPAPTRERAAGLCSPTSTSPPCADKMIAQDSGEVLITNDGATILDRMMVQQPAAKMLVELAKAQDVQARLLRHLACPCRCAPSHRRCGACSATGHRSPARAIRRRVTAPQP